MDDGFSISYVFKTSGQFWIWAVAHLLVQILKVSGLLLSIRDTHTRPGNESKSSPMTYGDLLLNSSLFPIIMLLSSSLGLPLVGPPARHPTCIYLHLLCTSNNYACTRPKGKQQREAMGTYPHPLETTAPLTEREVLPAQNFGVLGSGCYCCPYQEICLPVSQA